MNISSWFHARFSILLALAHCVAVAQTPLVLQGHDAPVNAVAFSPNGKVLVSGSKDETIRVWDPSTGQLLRTIPTKGSSVKRISFDSAGTKFLAGLYEKVMIADPLTGKSRLSKTLHTSFIEGCSFSPDNTRIVTSSWRDESLSIQKVSNFKTVVKMKEAAWTDNALFNNDGSKVYSVTHENLLKCWDSQTGSLLRTYAAHEDWIYDLCLSNDGNFAYTASLDNTIRIWDLASGKNIFTLKGHSKGVVCIDLSADGRWLASGGLDHEVIVWDLKDNSIARRIAAHDDTVMDVKFSADGKTLASCSADKSVKLWPLAD